MINSSSQVVSSLQSKFKRPVARVREALQDHNCRQVLLSSAESSYLTHRKISASNMQPKLHSLCDLCAKIRFTLHSPTACAALRCPYNAGDENFKPLARRRASSSDDVHDHSEILQHAPSITELEASAQNGCHLCTLLLFALNHSYAETRSASSSVASDGYQDKGTVTLLLLRITHKGSSPPDQELFVFWGTRRSVFDVTDGPPTRDGGCLGIYRGLAWRSPSDPTATLYSEGNTRFYARCVGARGPLILRDGKPPEYRIELVDGLPRLINYLPGQVGSGPSEAPPDCC
jgi:hypothetical protein